MIWYFDMDGVLADFSSSARDDLETIAAGSVPAIHEWQLWEGEAPPEDSLITTSQVFWENLRPIEPCVEAAKELIERCEDFYILSSAMYAVSATPKIKWCARHLGVNPNTVILATDKFLLANEDTVLVDDRLDNCMEFIYSGGQAILVVQPWTFSEDRKFLDTSGVERLIITDPHRLSEAVTRMRDKETRRAPF